MMMTLILMSDHSDGYFRVCDMKQLERTLGKNLLDLVRNFSTKTYDVGTQKNCLNETVLLSTQNICYKLWVRKYLQFYAEIVVYLQELEDRSLYHLYSLITKSSRCHYVVMTRSETKLSVAIPAPVSGQSTVNVAMATSKCSITFLLPYDQDGDVKTKQDNVSNIG